LPELRSSARRARSARGLPRVRTSAGALRDHRHQLLGPSARASVSLTQASPKPRRLLRRGFLYPPTMAILYIDADACPVAREAISIAREAGLEVVLVGNSTQGFGRHTARKGVDSVTVQTGGDSADCAIVEMLAA